MKIKSFILVAMLIISGVVVSASVNDNVKEYADESIKEIRVAVYTDTKDEAYFLSPLKNYNWKVGQTTYCFVPTILSSKSILRGELKIENYDVLIYSFNQADQHILGTSLSILPKNKMIVRNIVNFVKDGGGYYGSCGGCGIAGGMKNKPKSFLERAMKQSDLGISGVEFQYYTAIPILTELRGNDPKTVDMQSYLFYSSWHVSNPHDMNFSGVCPDINISKDNPIFDDFIGNTRKMRWIGFPALEVPEQPDREIIVLAKFPEEEISDNESAQIHYWTYTGGLSGLIKGLLCKDEIEWCENLGALMNSFVFSGDWKKTDKIVETYVANKPFITAEIYPNENKARIVRCPGHPELVTWWGGHLQDVEDTDANNIYEGFHKLVGATPLDETAEDEMTYNYCVTRRIIAWEAKIPDNDLPPVYGASQVSDICPYKQPYTFTIIGNVEEAKGKIITLNLYYSHSDDNSSNWSDWALYGTDANGKDGWSWEFSAPDGLGYYKFYSIRNVEDDGSIETETAPPGPDAMAYID